MKKIKLANFRSEVNVDAPQNILFISFTLPVDHSDTSEVKEDALANIPAISVQAEKFHLLRSSLNDPFQ